MGQRRRRQRDFTYVEDIVDGCLLAAEKISDCTSINLGTGKQYKILDVASLIFKISRLETVEVAL